MLCVSLCLSLLYFFFFFNDTATTEIYTLSLHDALPIYRSPGTSRVIRSSRVRARPCCSSSRAAMTSVSRPSCQRASVRSEEHTSELQSLAYLVCRLLLEKKKNRKAHAVLRLQTLILQTA